jgi:hypothetical protein
MLSSVGDIWGSKTYHIVVALLGFSLAALLYVPICIVLLNKTSVEEFWALENDGLITSILFGAIWTLATFSIYIFAAVQRADSLRSC